jgi:hypothetical protein
MPVNPVFIVGRFRSGTTALWNVFRQSPHVFAVYEPLHDQLLMRLRSVLPVDPSHHRVSDYFKELRPHFDRIAAVHRREFATARLALGGEDDHPELKEYISTLISLAGHQRAVLKFVRADFRLPWLKRNFPDAIILYIWRNPRDQWISMLGKHAEEWANLPRVNAFYLNTFSSSLISYLPDLMSPEMRHSYASAYLLWRISKALGERYSDRCIDFDTSFSAKNKHLFDDLEQLTGVALGDKAVATVQRPDGGPRWPRYADQVPFPELERKCEIVLSQSGLLKAIAAGDLDTAWPSEKGARWDCVREAVECLNLDFSVVDELLAQCQTEGAGLHADMKRLQEQQIELNRIVLGLQDENSLLERKLSAAQSQLDQLHAVRRTLQDENSLLERKLSAAQSQLDQLHAVRRTLEAQLGEAVNARLVLENQLVDSQAGRAELESWRLRAESRMEEYERERNMFGAQFGRWLTRQRNSWAPPHSWRGKLMSAVISALRAAYRSTK